MVEYGLSRGFFPTALKEPARKPSFFSSFTYRSFRLFITLILGSVSKYICAGNFSRAPIEEVRFYHEHIVTGYNGRLKPDPTLSKRNVDEEAEKLLNYLKKLANSTTIEDLYHPLNNLLARERIGDVNELIETRFGKQLGKIIAKNFYWKKSEIILQAKPANRIP